MLVAALLSFLALQTFQESFRAGLTALQQGDLSTARTKLETASAIAPGDAKVWVALSQVYWKLRKNDEAEQAAEKAAALGPNEPVVSQSLSIYYSETGQPLKAARYAVKYGAKERAAELYFEAAKPMMDRQKFDEAADVLEEGLSRAPDSAQLELGLGVCDYALRRFEKAAEAFFRTIELAPETEQPYVFLGKMLDQIPAGLPLATRRFAEYETAHPDRAAGYLLHAKALNAQAADPERALGLLDRAIGIDANDASAQFERGLALDRLRRFTDAVAAFERATQLAPEDAAAHYRLARDYDRIGKHEAAQAEREKHARLVSASETMR